MKLKRTAIVSAQEGSTAFKAEVDQNPQHGNKIGKGRDRGKYVHTTRMQEVYG
jgi:hypothetical protein